MKAVTSVSMVRAFQRSRSSAAIYANGCAFRNPPKGAAPELRERWADRWLDFHRKALGKPVAVGETVLDRLEHAVKWAQQCDQDYIGNSTIATSDLDVAVKLMRRALEAEIKELVRRGPSA